MVKKKTLSSLKKRLGVLNRIISFNSRYTKDDNMFDSYHAERDKVKRQIVELENKSNGTEYKTYKYSINKKIKGAVFYEEVKCK